MTKLFGFGFDVWLLEIDVNGDTIWTKRYSAGYFCSVQQTSNEGYILAGWTASFGAYISTVSTIVSIGTPYPVPVFANLYIFVYDMQRAKPVPVK